MVRVACSSSQIQQEEARKQRRWTGRLGPQGWRDVTEPRFGAGLREKCPESCKEHRKHRPPRLPGLTIGRKGCAPLESQGLYVELEPLYE